MIPNSFDASNTSNAGGISLVQSAMAELADADNRIKELQSARVIALDIIPGAVPMETYRFPQRCLLLFGAEGPGLSQKALDLADDVVYISQFGSVRSINAGAAAAVAMHAWIAQHATIA
ncbi:TrmH family RNA methyltransferase [Bifidobacterium imperatoris]|uniref:TrmH family RNA methyltransferase n=1 Tax=Bifidobacterium imperatoris TaxID=2020965 RepID=UPI003BF96762